MSINPILEIINEKKVILSKIQYPVKVYCIVDDLSDASRDIRIREIKNHAIEAGVIFTTRLYDSTKYSNDRDVITRLPAFHVYIKKAYDRTFYSNTRPLDHINECVALYLNSENAKKERKARWAKLYGSFKTFLWRLVHKETAMERHERETYMNTKKARLERMKLNVSEWA